MLTLPDYLTGFESDLAARNRRPETIRGYLKTARAFVRWLEKTERSTVVTEITPNDVRAWLAELHEQVAPATVAQRFRSLQQLFKFILAEGDSIDVSPMARLKAPSIPDKPIPVFSDEDIAALKKACAGTDFEARRDLALIGLFLDSGARLTEVTDLKVADLDTKTYTFVVTVKGGHRRFKKFTPATARDLERYLRARKTHGHAESGYLFLGKRGRLQTQGVRRALERRAEEAGIQGMHPHRFRHTRAHQLLRAGVHEGEVMSLMGWRSRQMLDRYGAAVASERAFDSYDRLAKEGTI